MAEKTLVVSSSTDGQEAVESAAQGTPEGVPVSESSLQDFRESESTEGQTVTTSYENSGSERNALLARLSEAEREIELLPEAPADQARAVDESGLTVEERAQIRATAIQDAISTARRQHAYSDQDPAQQFQTELDSARAQWATSFGNRMSQLRSPESDQLFESAIASGLGVTNAVTDTLTALEHGPDVLLHLLRNHDEMRRLLRLPDHLASAHVASLAAQLSAPPRRARSAAPEPIRPVGGSSTRSSLSADELPYQEFVKFREKQIKANRRGR